MNVQSRRRFRLVSRDLAALSAFAPIGLSGAAPIWASLVVVLAVGLSLAGIRPLSGRAVVSVLILLGAALLLFGSVFRGGLDLVVAAVTFASLVTAQRLATESSPSTDHQALLTSLLMLAGGAAIAGELYFGLFAFVFTFAGATTLGLQVLEGGELAEAEVPMKPVLRRLWLGTFFAVVGALAFFIFFPRLSWNLAARRAGPGLGGTTGMTDRVRLGGGGDIKTSTRAVLRATLNPDPKRDHLERYWLGRVFDTFDGREWRGSGEVQPAKSRVLLTESLTAKTMQNIDLLPAYEAVTAVALDRPVSFSNAQVIGTSGTSRASLVEVSNEEVRLGSTGNAYSYSAWSADPDDADEGAPLPDLARTTQLPEGLDPRVVALAKEVLDGEGNPLRAARRLENHLRTRFEYTLELPGEVPDPLADFLFVRKAGHCEHFATALTVLLRTQGFSARVAAGFFGGERAGSRYVVRAGDAHAWTQVFVPGRGWVTFDATPDGGRRRQATAILEWLATRYEELEALWRAKVVDYTFQDQVDLARALVRPPQSRGGSGPSLPSREAMLSALGAGVAVFLVVRLLGRRRSPKAHPVASFLDEIEKALKGAGIARLEDEPLESVAARLSGAGHPKAAAVRAVTRAYLGARFGGEVLSRERKSSLLAQLSVR